MRCSPFASVRSAAAFPAMAVRAAALAAVFLAGLLPAPGAQAATQLLRVHLGSKAEYLRLLEVAPEATDCGVTVGDDYLEFAAQEGRLRVLTAQGFRVESAVDDLESFYASRLSRRETRDDFGAYHTYTEAIDAMDALVAAHPHLIAPKQSIGLSLEGRPIYVYKISDHPEVDEDEPEIFFNAYIHAREVITFEVLYDLARYLTEHYGNEARATTLVDTREIWLLPCVNPDGVEYNRQTNPNGGGMWRKNRRNNGDGSFGIDLNRNFGFNWGYDNQGSSPNGADETYRGTGPFSEPETAAFRDFVASRRFQTALNYHSYSNLHLTAPGFDNVHTGDYDELITLGRLRRATNGYSTGTSWELLYFVNGDCNDWMLQDEVTKPKIFPFVTEVGTQSDGFWPAESRIPALLAENRECNLRMCELADNPLRALPPGLPQIDGPDQMSVPFTLTWSTPAPDADNPAVSWNLVEATGHAVGVDDLEGDTASRWTADGWTLVTNRSHSATHSFRGGNASMQNNVLVSQRGYRVRPGDQLRFWTWYSLENGFDYGYVEVATDARTYAAIAGSITTNHDPNNRNLGHGITGSSGGWVQASFPLTAFEGQTIWVRFRYSSDRFTALEGWYVDDIEPADLFATETIVATALPAAQYAFPSHEEGSFSYLVQSVDAEGDVSAWSAPKDLEISGASDAATGASAEAWRGLELIGPHPARGEARLRCTIPSSARPGDRFRLALYDLQGRDVRALREGSLSGDALPGRVVDATCDLRSLPSGLYFARLEVGGRRAELRVLVMQ